MPSGQSATGAHFRCVLYEKVYSKEVLSYAWEQVRRNRGSAGVDNETIEDMEAYRVDRLLEELHEDLRARRYGRVRCSGCLSPSPMGGRGR
jgi:RNA-directed DNA polymerase